MVCRIRLWRVAIDPPVCLSVCLSVFTILGYFCYSWHRNCMRVGVSGVLAGWVSFFLLYGNNSTSVLISYHILHNTLQFQSPPNLIKPLIAMGIAMGNATNATMRHSPVGVRGGLAPAASPHVPRRVASLPFPLQSRLES